MDALYGAAEAIERFMSSGPPLPLSVLYIAIAGIPVVLLHELGHALAVSRRLGQGTQVTVGSAGKVAELRLGEISATINAFASLGAVAGSAAFDDSRATAGDVLWVAVAGPLASLAGTLLAASMLAVAPESGVVHDLIWAAVLGGVFGVLNLVPLEIRERRDGPPVRTDGRLALDASRTVRALR